MFSIAYRLGDGSGSCRCAQGRSRAGTTSEQPEPMLINGLLPTASKYISKKSY
ncbi:hypothetical protein [Ferruginibacter albus]|uniref:hypothetical protein n=1 Tax=Ferruginibacter albus TaxID=2875540 RepID=UPI001CC58FA3|nr:hypothetical protein [Ferruginibacter albus]UAY53526.1 hypothetical protein K9M53_07620 [Ferruginibacter albus]